MIGPFSRKATDGSTKARANPSSDTPVQAVPVEIKADGKVLGRFKVDVAVREGDRVRIGGWRIGDVELGVENGVISRRSEFARADVAAHFHLDPQTSIGFSLELDAAPEPLRLVWRGGDGSLGQAELALGEWATLCESDKMLLGLPAASNDRAARRADARNDEIVELRDSGLVDAHWYKTSYPDVAEAEVEPVEHYFFRGAAEGRNPNRLFDSRWYCETNPDVAASGANPLLHYIQFGESEGRRPSAYFEPRFYRQSRSQALQGGPLLDYLRGGWRDAPPNEFFQADFYLERYPDVRSAGVEPLLHYLESGWREEREIHRVYSFARHGRALAKRLGWAVNPLWYHLHNGRANGEALPGYADEAEQPGLLGEQIRASQRPGEHFEDRPIGTPALSALARTRLFAFYLPQFHPFEENDRWWGPGFTEWTNVTRALPRFVGHQQPRLPRDLGYYDLRNIDTIRAQVRLARDSGVAGFCFYYYWFNGKRLLDKPLDAFLADRRIEFPFCLMWANENWTRRWDGMENDVLMAQEYRPEDDEALVADFARYFRDPRYERVDGRPLLIVYRPGVIPEARARIATWRRLFAQAHGVEPLILMAQCFGDHDPRPFGLDGAIEFPPHKLSADLAPVNSRLELFDGRFKGHYLDYEDLVRSSREVDAPGFDLVRTLVPAWDNEARKPGRGMGFVGANPERYEAWLRYLVGWSGDHPVRGRHSYVFVNAWNEWAEGAHLEPDVHNGAAYLNATLRALTGLHKARAPAKRILLVGHDAFRHGAQLLLLNLMRTLREEFGVEPVLALLAGGPLLEDYRRFGKVFVAEESLDSLLDTLQIEVPEKVALCNTVVAGHLARHLAERGFRVVAMVHELPRLIAERGLEPRAHDIARHADRVLFAAEPVRSGFETIVGPLAEKAEIQPQGIYQDLPFEPGKSSALRERLRLPASARIVINLGYADLRKGFDLFVQVARQVAMRDAEAHFVWLGELQGDLKLWLAADMDSERLRGRIHVLPFSDEVSLYLNGADAMAMTSREDPFPSVVLEALACGLPVVAFEGGGGCVEAIARHTDNGRVVPMADTSAMARALTELLRGEDPDKRRERSERAKSAYVWRDYAFGLLQRLYPDLKKVSVVVPNYNYARYLPERMGSIFSQDYPIYEFIFLDDLSTDASVEVAERCARAAGRRVMSIANRRNSGSVFRQWEAGARIASGDYIWIAEADDASEPGFLSGLMELCGDGATLAFCDSMQIDGDGRRLGDSYGFYYRSLPGNPMVRDFRMAGPDFLRRTLSIKNVIMNVSSAIFDRAALLRGFDRVGEDVRSYKVAGDWRMYVDLLGEPESSVVYGHRPDNVHRLHAKSVTHALESRRHVDEIARVQTLVASTTSLDEETCAYAADYLEEVSHQLLSGVSKGASMASVADGGETD